MAGTSYGRRWAAAVTKAVAVSHAAPRSAVAPAPAARPVPLCRAGARPFALAASPAGSRVFTFYTVREFVFVYVVPPTGRVTLRGPCPWGVRVTTRIRIKL